MEDAHLFTGFMQPQGHVQVLVNMIDFGMDPQTALDQPRFCIESGEAGGYVCLEEGVREGVEDSLKSMGHDIRLRSGRARYVFGRGQIILKNANEVYVAGSDPRADGCAMGLATNVF